MTRYFLDTTHMTDTAASGDTSAGEPIEFRELVRLVREGRVAADQRVREERGDWQYAGDVIGLFHLADRTDVLERWEEERRQRDELLSNAETASGSGGDMSLNNMESLLLDADGLVDDEEEPAWQKRLREVEAQRAAEIASLAELTSDATAADRLQALKDAAIEEALEAVDSRATGHRFAGAVQAFSSMFSTHSLHLMFRFGTAILTGSLAIISILSWSETEALRFPTTRVENESAMIFPFWGTCSQGEYGFLLFDSALVTCLIGYLVAIQLERLTDDA